MPHSIVVLQRHCTNMSDLDRRYIEYRELFPDRLDIFTLIITISLVVGIIAMVYWILTILTRPLERELEEEERMESKRRSEAAREPDYLNETTSTESVPMEVVIQRPEHTLSQRDRATHIILSQSSAPSAQTAPTHTQEDTEYPPVLNVIWEPSEGGATPEGDRKSRRTKEPRQLISSIPLYVNRPTRRGVIQEPVTVNLYLEPVPVAQEGKAPFPDVAQSSYQPAGVPIPNDTAPSITLTTTTTKTTVSTPGPGFTKRVTEVHTQTKQIRKEPSDQSVQRDHSKERSVPMSSGSDAEEDGERSSSLLTAVEVPLNALRMEKATTSSTASTQVARPSSTASNVSAQPPAASSQQPAVLESSAIDRPVRPSAPSSTSKSESQATHSSISTGKPGKPSSTAKESCKPCESKEAKEKPESVPQTAAQQVNKPTASAAKSTSAQKATRSQSCSSNSAAKPQHKQANVTKNKP